MIALFRIGRINTPYHSLAECPANVATDGAPCRIVLDPAYADGLAGIVSASHLIVLYWLGDADRTVLRSRTRHDGIVRGVFANRSPSRPNPIGFGVVRLLDRDGEVLTVSGLDCLDGTPLLDLKPYLPQLDARGEAAVNW